MTQAVITALIVGLCSIVSAALSALISKQGFAFWRSATVIHCTGTAKELRAIRTNDDIDVNHRGYAYDIRDATLTVRGGRATFTGLLTTTDGEAKVSDGHTKGQGRVHNGVAFLVYSVVDANRKQAWSGTLVLRMPGLGDLTGYWLTQDHVEPGVLAFGSVSLHRS